MSNLVVEAFPNVDSPATFKVVDLRFEIVEEELLEMKYPETSRLVVEALVKVSFFVFLSNAKVLSPLKAVLSLNCTSVLLPPGIPPPPPVTQVPFTEKHLPEVTISIAPVKEDVAEPVIFKRLD